MRRWLSQGYPHLHLGAIRLALTFHGHKGLPVVARIALLDTQFLDCEHAYIGIVETTLNAGKVSSPCSQTSTWLSLILIFLLS